MIQTIFLVGIGGAIGSIFRYLITRYLDITMQSSFPFGTLAVNLAGSFFIGIIIALSLGESLGHNMRMLLATGFCGGFTTFSTFSFEFYSLLQHGQTGYAFLYATASFVLGLAFVGLGFSLIR